MDKAEALKILKDYMNCRGEVEPCDFDDAIIVAIDALKPIPSEEIREKVAEWLAERDGYTWEELPEIKPRKHYLYEDRQNYRSEADQILALFDKPVLSDEEK